MFPTPPDRSSDGAPAPSPEQAAAPSPEPVGPAAIAPDVQTGEQIEPAPAARSPLSRLTATRSGISPLHLALVVVALLSGAALFLSGYSLGARTATTPGTPVSEDEAFTPFWDTYRAITERYAGGDVDRQKLIEGAIKGMFDALGDPYSSYLSPEEYRQSLQGISGQFEGIGAEIGTKAPDGTTGQCATLGPDCQLVVVAPIEGSPAEKAGLKAGDVITQIDGSTVDGLTVDDSVDRVRGPKGTAVTLTIVRDGGEPFDIEITRDVIVQKEVVSRALADGQVGYVKLTGFSDNGATELTEKIREHVDAGRKKLILDLRGDPGGFVTAARKIASQFIAEGPIFWQEDAQGNQVATNAEPDGVATDPSIRLVVLVDRGSASASEIVAGAIQDSKRGQLVGETTFGKGTVQQWQPLENDSGGFRLTVAKWLTPNKRWIHGEGLTPDIAVATPDQPAEGEDPVLDRALEVLDGSSASGPALRKAA